MEWGLKRPSTDVLARLATALDMLLSELLRQIEEMSAKGRGLLRKRILEAPMHEHPQGPAEPAMLFADMAHATARAGVPDLEELVRIASTLDPKDLRVLLDLARRLSRPSGK
ncbi:MAG: hypothetical protein A2W26_02150 [Acidobacteria bacterium RBG_16_64_8]|nr:MAG: hypothetical protein A2W26_02150 [Acidobacteria bacterium RBG_16_64_8]